MNNLKKAYELGWIQASKWAEREELIADIGSPAYVREADAALATHQKQAEAVQDDLITIRKPTTSAEALWLLKLARLVLSDVNKTLDDAFAPAQPQATTAQADNMPEQQTKKGTP